ncbi:MAG: FIST N-terminal domain-containing protein [Negativicutes bacterium]|nr:FIST N-terminal domain-containing protein [Negativicutes bacterium]
MLQTQVGWSEVPGGLEAGRQAAQKAMAGMTDISLVVVYGSVNYDQVDLLQGVTSVTGNVPLVGCSSFNGVLTPDGFVSGKEGFCVVMALADEALKVAVAGTEKNGSARETGQFVAREAMARLGTATAPAFFFMIAPPGEEESYLKGIEDIVGRVPFFGGTSADNTMEGLMRQYANGLVIQNGVVAAFFCTDKPFANAFTGAYRSTGKTGVITKVENRRTLKEIDGRPALAVYADWRGVQAEELKGLELLTATIHYPLGVSDSEGDLTWIRHFVTGNEDLSMTGGSDLAENTAVCLMETTTDELVAAVRSAVAEAKAGLGAEPGALFLIHCAGRSIAIGDRMNEVAAGIKEAAGELPFAGVLTFGEFGYGRWTRNGCGGLMLSVFMLAR